MEKVTLKEYAKKHKLSIYNVIKMVRSGELETLTQEEEGKEVLYILVDAQQEEMVEEAIIPQDPPKSLKEENMLLRGEIKRLKKELERCKKRKR